MKEESVSVLKAEKVTGETSVGSESQVKLGRTFHPVKIAAVGEYMLYCTVRIGQLICTRQTEFQYCVCTSIVTCTFF